MELTRRDVLAALAAAGVVGAGAHEYAERDGGSADPPLTDHETATLVAVAEVAYPSAVSNVPDFARRYSVARVNDDADYRAGSARPSRTSMTPARRGSTIASPP
ncbi:twin-arginine translocation signal domain-containing protein, partial [Halarchaeum acidiphilum]|uniref:twin-arginine translocation signal domain-containing protein n=1 Tax=Halarchaeum acidiphilum TaxID=489138 RepID=UPI000373F340